MLEPLLPESFQLWHIPLVFAASLLGEGFGAVIGGGSVVTQPALLLTGLPLNSVIAIDNAGALGTEAGVLTETHQEIRRRWRMIVFMFIPMMLGGIVGTWGLLNASTDLIKPIMAVAVALLLIRSYLFKDKFLFLNLRRWQYPALFLFLIIIGAYNNLIGVGEGTFARLGIVLILGMTFLQSHGFKTISTVPVRLYSLVVTGLAGLIVWPYLLAMWAGSFLAGKYATKNIKRVPEQYMRHILAGVSVLFIVYIVGFV